jgi:hypothetical protein
MEDMIHEALEGGGGITQAKGHDQKLIVTLVSSKGSLGYVNFLHTYLVVARTQIKFSEVLSTNQLIQEIINDRNGELVLDGELIEGMKVRRHTPSTLFLKHHDHRGRIRAGTGANNTHLEKFLHYFLNLILLGKGVMIRVNIGRKNARNKGNGMIMNTMRRRKFLRGGKNNLMCGNDGLEVRMHRGCLNDLNRMELSNDTGVAFIKDIFYMMGTNDLRRTNYETLELVPLSFLLELRG